MNNMCSFVAGHFYERESPFIGMIREFEEKCGLRLQPHELEVVGVMYSVSADFNYINLVNKSDLSRKKIENKELENALS